MSYDDYQMISIENEDYKQRYENLAQEKMVYLAVADNRTRYSHISQISGQIVEKDELLKKMQEHLESAKRKMQEREANYERCIDRLKEELHQASIKQSTVTKWWNKLF